jgi:uncharacterized protein YlaI
MVKQKQEEKECPLCGEYLKLNREGVMKNPNGDFIYVYLCEECNQAFALDEDDKLKLIPYNSEMKPIENKCKICNKIENYNEKGLFLLNIDTAYYEFHCFECAISILQDWINKNGKKKIKVTDKNVQGIYAVYDFNKNNEMLKEMQEHPEKYKETMDKVKEGFDNIEKGGLNSSQP